MLNEFVSDIEESGLFKEINPYNIVTKDYAESKYPHLTFKVDNLFDYIKIINLLSDTVKDTSFVNGELLYRGMANEDWDLKPTLGRIKNNEILEYNLVNSFINYSPADFMNLNTSFELLSKMQHYGLPTRLLDFTSNPLIALYFSCSDEKNINNNARIICHRAYVKISQDEIIESLCGIYKYPYVDDLYLDELKVSPFKYLWNLYGLTSDRLLIARPAYWNKRIQNQQAIFMIFPNKLYDYYAYWAHGGEKEFPFIWENEGMREVLEMVKKEPLEEIYEKNGILDFYINHKTIKQLFDYYKKDDYATLENWKKPFQERFRFSFSLDTIDEEILENDFCSIIIDKRNKKKIIEQLKQIGIDKAFIYPELQYVAEKVKDMYINDIK